MAGTAYPTILRGNAFIAYLGCQQDVWDGGMEVGRRVHGEINNGKENATDKRKFVRATGLNRLRE